MGFFQILVILSTPNNAVEDIIMVSTITGAYISLYVQYPKTPKHNNQPNTPHILLEEIELGWFKNILFKNCLVVINI